MIKGGLCNFIESVMKDQMYNPKDISEEIQIETTKYLIQFRNELINSLAECGISEDYKKGINTTIDELLKKLNENEVNLNE